MEAELLEDLELGHNSLKSLGGGIHADGSVGNSALWPLKSLKSLNLTHNELSEFSFVTLRGLRELRLLDLSSNRIARLLRGRPPTEVRHHINFSSFVNSHNLFQFLVFMFWLEFGGGGRRRDSWFGNTGS